MNDQNQQQASNGGYVDDDFIPLLRVEGGRKPEGSAAFVENRQVTEELIGEYPEAVASTLAAMHNALRVYADHAAERTGLPMHEMVEEARRRQEGQGRVVLYDRTGKADGQDRQRNEG